MASAPFLVTFGTLLGAQNGSQNCSANLRGRSGGTRWPSRTPPGPSVTHCELFLGRGGAFAPHSAPLWRFLGVILVHFGVTLGPWWVRFGFVHCHVGALVGFTPRTPHRNHTRTSHTTHTHKQDQAHTQTHTQTHTHKQVQQIMKVSFECRRAIDARSCKDATSTTAFDARGCEDADIVVHMFE